MTILTAALKAFTALFVWLNSWIEANLQIMDEAWFVPVVLTLFVAALAMRQMIQSRKKNQIH